MTETGPVLDAPAMPIAPRPPVPAVAPAPAMFGYAPAPVPVRDDFTAINLLVPQQQTLPVRALVWGLVSVFFSVTIAPSIFAIVFGVLGVRRSRRLEDAGLGAQGYGLSVAGLVLGIIGAVMLLLAIVGVVLAIVFTAHPPVRSYPS